MLGAVSKNAMYRERDTDGDGVIDSADNCPTQANAEQRDGNNNGVGDACDDYDYDGVMTAVDNCPTEVNPNQNDVDRDGIGDACDQEESRITEKYG
jgi:ferredoxin